MSKVSQKPFEKFREWLEKGYEDQEISDIIRLHIKLILSEFDKAYSESRKQIEERRSKLEVGPISPVKITRQQELNWILENILPEISEKIE